MTDLAAQTRPALTTRRLRTAAVPYCLYLLLVSAFWLPYSRQLNADGVSYLSIASEYAAGHWQTAVNTYWSPLFSWLLAAGIASNAPPSVFTRLLLIASGFAGLIGLERLLAGFALDRAIVQGVMITAAPMFCYFALHDVTPDVLALALLLFYLGLTCRQQMTPAQWALAGILGALVYLAKAYCFLFVIAHLAVTAAIRIRAVRNGVAGRTISRYCAAAIGIVILLSAPWFILISKKAGRPTISTAGSYNFALTVGPQNAPMLTRGLFAPPNPYAVSIWEDPDEMHLRAPVEPSICRRFLRRVEIIGRNFEEFVRYQLTASAFAPIILFAFVYGTAKRWRAGEGDIPAVCLLAAYVIYAAGYFFTFVEHRYIWVEDIVLLVMAASLLDSWHRKGLPRRNAFLCVALLTALSFSWAPLFILVKHRNDLHAVNRLVPELQALHLSGNMASNARWDDTQYLAYRLGLRYYGMPAQNSGQANESALIAHNVHYVFVWHVAGAAILQRPGEKMFGSALLDVYALPPT